MLGVCKARGSSPVALNSTEVNNTGDNDNLTAVNKNSLSVSENLLAKAIALMHKLLNFVEAFMWEQLSTEIISNSKL